MHLSRTYWVGWDINDHMLLRFGRLNLPYGLRIPEHTMFVRADTRTNRESQQQLGPAFSYSQGRWRGELMGIVGNPSIHPPKFWEYGYSLYGEYAFTDWLALGVSSLVTYASDSVYVQNGKPYTRVAQGITARVVPYKQLAVLGEANVLASTGFSTGYAAMLQADYEFIQGLHGLLTGEIQDAGSFQGAPASTGAGKPQMRGWITAQWFFFTHFDARVDFLFTQDSNTELLSQVHWYF